MENKIAQELIERAKQAGSAEELLALAKENGVKLTAEEAQEVYEMWHASAELSDEELENAAGGSLCSEKAKCPYCGSENVTEKNSVLLFSDGFGSEYTHLYFCGACHRQYWDNGDPSGRVY